MFDSEPALSAFKVMRKREASAICIVDGEGNACGVLTLRDLRGLGVQTPRMERLWEDIKR